MSDLIAGLEAFDEAEPAYLKAERYYDGEVDEVMCSDSALTRTLARTGKRYKLNFAKTPVNVVADRLEIAAVTVPGDPAATQLLQERVWDANQLTLESPDNNRKTCEFGDGYLVVWDGATDGTVDVWFNSPLSMRLFYDEENPRTKTYAIRKPWKVADGRSRTTLYYADRVERYITKPQQTGENAADWEEFTDKPGDVWPTPNPHGEVPVFHLRTGSPYGTPVHKDAYGPQDALNKLVITMMATTDYSGFPLRYALVDGDAQVTGDASVKPLWEDDAQAAKGTREVADLTVSPGHVWLASGLKGVGQLDPSDPNTHFLDPASWMVRAMATATTTPLRYFDPSGDHPSGESLRASDAPLAKHARYIQMRLASAYGEALSFALKVLGKPGLKVDVRWTPTTSTDDLDSWTTAKAKIDAGVPVRQVLLEQGYTAEQVDQWIADNGEDNLRERVALLAEIGKAVQSLGAGISLGAVSADVVNAAVTAMLVPATKSEQIAA